MVHNKCLEACLPETGGSVNQYVGLPQSSVVTVAPGILGRGG